MLNYEWIRLKENVIVRLHAPQCTAFVTWQVLCFGLRCPIEISVDCKACKIEGHEENASDSTLIDIAKSHGL